MIGSFYHRDFPVNTSEFLAFLQKGLTYTTWRIQYKQCVPLTIFYHLYFLGISKVSSMLHHGSVGRVHSKECYFLFAYTFLAFFYRFLSKILCFIIFTSFFDEVSNFRYRTLTNQKPELVIINCQWNCMQEFMEIKTWLLFYCHVIKEYGCLKNAVHEIDWNEWMLLSVFQQCLLQNLS